MSVITFFFESLSFLLNLSFMLFTTGCQLFTDSGNINFVYFSITFFFVLSSSCFPVWRFPPQLYAVLRFPGPNSSGNTSGKSKHAKCPAELASCFRAFSLALSIASSWGMSSIVAWSEVMLLIEWEFEERTLNASSSFLSILVELTSSSWILFVCMARLFVQLSKVLVRSFTFVARMFIALITWLIEGTLVDDLAVLIGVRVVAAGRCRVSPGVWLSLGDTCTSATANDVWMVGGKVNDLDCSVGVVGFAVISCCSVTSSCGVTLLVVDVLWGGLWGVSLLTGEGLVAVVGASASEKLDSCFCPSSLETCCFGETTRMILALLLPSFWKYELFFQFKHTVWTKKLKVFALQNHNGMYILSARGYILYHASKIKILHVAVIWLTLYHTRKF